MAADDPNGNKSPESNIQSSAEQQATAVNDSASAKGANEVYGGSNAPYENISGGHKAIANDSAAMSQGPDAKLPPLGLDYTSDAKGKTNPTDAPPLADSNQGAEKDQGNQIDAPPTASGAMDGAAKGQGNLIDAPPLSEGAMSEAQKGQGNPIDAPPPASGAMDGAAKGQGNPIDAPPVAKGDNAVGAGQPLTSDQLQAQTGDRGIAPSYAPAASSSSAARGDASIPSANSGARGGYTDETGYRTEGAQRGDTSARNADGIPVNNHGRVSNFGSWSGDVAAAGAQPVKTDGGQPTQNDSLQPAQTDVRQPAQTDGTQQPQTDTMQPTQTDGTQQPQTDAMQPAQADGTQQPQTDAMQPVANAGDSSDKSKEVAPEKEKEASDKTNYVTATGKEVELNFPAKALYGPPTPEQYQQLQQNQQALLESLQHLKQGEFPRLAFHGTSEEGKNFIEETKTSKDKMGHSASGEIWTSMSKMEGTDAKTYLNDLQHSIAHASPGHLAIIDAGEAAKWGRAIPGYPSRTSGVSPYGSPLDETTESIVGKQSERVGKNTLGFTPENYDKRVLGFVDQAALLRPELGQHRNQNAEAFDLQKTTADVLEKVGLLKRK
jgi:hypothetical protein